VLRRSCCVPATSQQASDRNILIDCFPVQANAAHFHLLAFGRRGAQQPRKPGKRDAKRPPIGQIDPHRHGASPDPEFKLALKAILSACADAGLDPREIDGFSSYSDDRSEASRLAAALGTCRLRSATMQWGGGGAVANAAASIVAGLADCVVVFRSLNQGQYGRFG
jgi:hypothetical protein